MKNVFVFMLSIFFIGHAFSQSIAYMKMYEDRQYNIDGYGATYLNKKIIEKLKAENLDVKPFSNTKLFVSYANKSISKLNEDQIGNLKMFNHSFIILHKSEKFNQSYRDICYGEDSDNKLRNGVNWQSEFVIFNLNTNQSKAVTLAISTFDCDNKKLESCSNVAAFAKSIKDFVNEEAAPQESPRKKEEAPANKTPSAYTGESILKKPSLMVLPNKINQSKWKNGEYQLSKMEKMLIAALKNKFEENKYTTFGFESVLKRVLENRQANDSVRNDIKSSILETSGIDFFVEFENLDENSADCNKVFDFKIRNYSTGEDVASDIRNLNSCGTSDDYKNFAAAVLNQGAIAKINDQFSSVISNGRKVVVIFTIANNSKAKFNMEFKGKKLGIHINDCLQKLALRGNLELEEESDLRKQAIVNIPLIDEKTSQRYQTTTFTEEVLNYLKTNADVECDRIVSRQVINIKIK